MASTGFRFAMFSALALGVAAPLAAQADDDAAIHAVVRAQETAFNAHDAAAYGQLLEPDADMVTSRGWWLKGRDAYAGKLGEVFAGPLGAAHVHAGEVTIRLVAADLALVHVKWTLAGPRKGGEAIDTQLLRKTDGRWRVASSQETDVAPEKAAKADAPAAMPQPARKCLLGRANGDCLIYK